jgi:acyl carrier protein
MSTVDFDAATVGEPVAAIADWLTARVAYYLEMRTDDVNRGAPLVDLGFDSVYAMTLGGDIEERFGVEVEPTVAWDYNTVDALAAYLHSRLRP